MARGKMAAVTDPASELNRVKQIMQAEASLYNDLYQRRKNQERIIELEKLKALNTISLAERQELNRLNAVQRANSKAKTAEDLRVANLRTALISKNIEYENALNRTVAEKNIATATRIADLKLNILHQQQATEIILNKSAKEKELESVLRIANLKNQLAQQIVAAEIEQTKTLEEIKLQAQIGATNTIIEIRKAGNDAIYQEELAQQEKLAFEEEKRAIKEIRRNNKNRTAEDKAELKRAYAKEKAIAKAERTRRNEARAARNRDTLELQNQIFGKGSADAPITLGDRLDGIKNMWRDSETGKFNITSGIGNSLKMLANLAQQLEAKVDEIAAIQGQVDTRLQGSQQATSGINGSYWNAINTNFTKYAGVTPYFQREVLTSNLTKLVGQGISYNVEQRAFLDTVKDKIATTFDATNGTLLRLVRIQKQDTTAARLGMESALTAFLNNMYETTEYMNGIAEQVRGNLAEALSLMQAENAVSLEHTVQKWMGSMYSVGMSDSAVNSIANAIGDIAAGNINTLTGDGAGNLVVMAANQAGLSIADILAEGMTDETANNLLATAVEYLAGLYNENAGSKVVQQQIAKVFGVAASDLKAAANLATNEKTIDAIFKTKTSYESNLDRLYEMASSMIARTSAGEILSNSWNNLQYTMASGMANNPVLYGIYKIGKLMEDTGADINIPYISVMGNGFDINATVSQLMRGGAMAGSLISGIGSMFSGGGGIDMKSTLRKMDVTKALSTGYASDADLIKTLKTVGIEVDENATRIKSNSLLQALDLFTDNSSKRNAKRSDTNGMSTSESGTSVGNSSSDDIKNTTLSEANSGAEAQLDSKKEQEEHTIDIENVYDYVVKIYELFEEVTDGSRSLSVTLPAFQYHSGIGTDGGLN